MLYTWFTLCCCSALKSECNSAFQQAKGQKTPWGVHGSEPLTPVRMQEGLGAGIRDLSINPASHGMGSDQLRSSSPLLLLWSPPERWAHLSTAAPLSHTVGPVLLCSHPLSMASMVILGAKAEFTGPSHHLHLLHVLPTSAAWVTFSSDSFPKSYFTGCNFPCKF